MNLSICKVPPLLIAGLRRRVLVLQATLWLAFFEPWQNRQHQVTRKPITNEQTTFTNVRADARVCGAHFINKFDFRPLSASTLQTNENTMYNALSVALGRWMILNNKRKALHKTNSENVKIIKRTVDQN